MKGISLGLCQAGDFVMERFGLLLSLDRISRHSFPKVRLGQARPLILREVEKQFPAGAQVTQSQSLGTRPGNLPFKQASLKVEKLRILLFVNGRKPT